MIAPKGNIESKVWQIILDSYGYDEDTHLFLSEYCKNGAAKWALKRAFNTESELVFLKHNRGVKIPDSAINDATMVRRVLELIVNGEDSGKYLGPGDGRINPAERRAFARWRR